MTFQIIAVESISKEPAEEIEIHSGIWIFVELINKSRQRLPNAPVCQH